MWIVPAEDKSMLRAMHKSKILGIIGATVLGKPEG